MRSLTIRVEPRPFAAAVAWAARQMPTRPVLPILAGMLLEVTGDTLTVSAYDYDVAARAEVDVIADGDGRLLVSGRMLAELAKTLPDKPLSLTVDGTQVTLRCGPVRVTLPVMPDDDYPALPELPEPAGTVPAGEFAVAVERVGVAADRAGAGGLEWLGGIRLSLGPVEIEAWGTDRWRAAIARIPWKSTGNADGQAVLARATQLMKAAKSFDSHDDLTIGVDPHRGLGLSAPGRNLVFRILVDDFPEQFPGLFPTRSDTPATVAVADLLVALERANVVRGGKLGPAQLTFTADGMGVESHHNETTAEAYELLDCEYAGPDITVGLNPEYLADALTGLRTDRAEISLAGPVKPVLLTAVDDPEQAYRHVVVPIRLAS